MSIQEPLTHQDTRRDVDTFLKSPSHALLLSGPEGSGKLTLAINLAEKLLAKNLVTGVNFQLIEPDDKGKITINKTRQLKQFIKLKSSQANEISRVIVISEAGKMQAPAQNSLLKLLEEPPNDTVIILTASLGDLKPTIISRTQTLTVRGLGLDDVAEYFGQQYTYKEIEQAYQISDGRIGVISDLLGSDEKHYLKDALNVAKSILSGSLYDRLCWVDKLAKDRQTTEAIITITARIARAGLKSSSKEQAISRWNHILKASYRADKALAINANTKLVLMNFVVNL